MLFNHFTAYSFSGEGLSETNAAARLSEMPFTVPEFAVRQHKGFEPPVPTHDELAHTVMGLTLICLRTETRKVPADVLRELVTEEVQKRERKGLSVSRADKLELKEAFEARLLPDAFPKTKRTYALIDHKHNWLIINEGSRNSAEFFVEQLREASGASIQPLQSKETAGITMRTWLAQGSFPGAIRPGARCKLSQGDGGATLTYTQHEIAEDAWMQNYLDEGHQVQELALLVQHNDDQVSAIVTHDFQVKGVKYGAIHSEQLREDSDGDEAALRDASLILSADAARSVIHTLGDAFGGISAGSPA